MYMQTVETLDNNLDGTIHDGDFIAFHDSFNI